MILRGVMLGLVALELLLGGSELIAQSDTRLVLTSGTGVPEHPGFVFGPFSSLAMNEAKEIAFLTTLRSARSELRAVVHSTGVTFSVVAFQGLHSPVPKAIYDAFSAPGINAAGVVTFTAQLRDEIPSSAIIRIDRDGARAVATSGTSVPGTADSTFQEFSAPLVNSAGNILFGGRTAGKTSAAGLYFWTPRGIQSLPLPADWNLSPSDLLVPIYFSRDEAVFVPRGAPPDTAAEQFFRAVAVKSFQELNPPPSPSDTVEVLRARPSEPPVKMLFVSTEGEAVQTAPIAGDPSQAVMAKRRPGVATKPLGRILGKTSDERGNIVFAATAADQENDLGLYCYCDGQVVRLTSPEEFLPILNAIRGKPNLSLAGDSHHAVAFIMSSSNEADPSAIYVTSVP